MMESELFTVRQVAEILHCGKPTVRRLIKEGKLQAIRPSNADLIPRGSLDAYIGVKPEAEVEQGGQETALAELDKDTEARTTRSKNLESQTREYRAKRDLTLAEIGLHSAEEFRVAQDTVEPREQEIEKHRQEAITMHERAVGESEKLRGITLGLRKAREQLDEYRRWCVEDIRSLIAYYEELDAAGAFGRHFKGGKEIKPPELRLSEEVYANRINLDRIWTDTPEASVEQAEEEQGPEE